MTNITVKMHKTVSSWVISRNEGGREGRVRCLTGDSGTSETQALASPEVPLRETASGQKMGNTEKTSYKIHIFFKHSRLNLSGLDFDTLTLFLFQIYCLSHKVNNKCIFIHIPMAFQTIPKNVSKKGTTLHLKKKERKRGVDTKSKRNISGGKNPLP